MAERLTHVPRVQEVWSLKPGLAKCHTVLQTVSHCFNIVAVLHWHYEVELGNLS